MKMKISVSFFLLYLFTFYWCTVDVQCCVSFRCTAVRNHGACFPVFFSDPQHTVCIRQVLDGLPVDLLVCCKKAECRRIDAFAFLFFFFLELMFLNCGVGEDS